MSRTISPPTPAWVNDLVWGSKPDAIDSRGEGIERILLESRTAHDRARCAGGQALDGQARHHDGQRERRSDVIGSVTRTCGAKRGG